MVITLSTYGLSFMAGMLSVLSPCVLPLLPMIIGTSFNTHRFGPYALALGLAMSFTAIGVLVATLGDSLGLGQDTFRIMAAGLLIVFGAILVSPTLQATFARVTSGLSQSGQGILSQVSTDSLLGQGLLGLILGLIWSPCVGPILGATLTLASQGQQLAQVALVMAVFGFGAGLPLILLGKLSAQAMSTMRTKLLVAGLWGKYALGGMMMLIGLLTMTGLDKHVEAYIVEASPDWLIRLSTIF